MREHTANDKIPALQGAFVEHHVALERLPYQRRLQVILVKTPEELSQCDALIIPGGGTCAAILLYAFKLLIYSREHNDRPARQDLGCP